MTIQPETAAAARVGVVDQIFGNNKAPLPDVLNADYADLRAEIEALTEEGRELWKPVTGDDAQMTLGRWIVRAKALAKKADGFRTDEGRPILEAQRGINGFFKELLEPLGKAESSLQKLADDYARQKAAEERAKAEADAKAAREKAEAERIKAEQMKTSDAAARAEGRAELLDAKADAAEERALASDADLTRMRAEGVTASARQSWDFSIDDEDALYASLGALGPFFVIADVRKAVGSMVRAHKGRTQLPGVRVFPKTTANFRG